MATITQLPDDVIIIILVSKTISVEDIMNFKYTCKRFEKMTLPNKFWERKYYESCPIAEKSYNKEKRKKLFDQISFKEKVETNLHCIQMLIYYAYLMSENKLYDTDKTHLERILLSIAKDSLTYHFIWDEINRISAQKSCEMFSNLTREYNFKLLFHYLKQYRFIHKQIKFLNMPTKKLLLEKQLTIVAQYFVPHVSYSAVKLWLDRIAHTVLLRLSNSYPTHLILSTSSEQFAFWRDNNIDDNFWDERESRQIMGILEKYIFSELEVLELYQLLMLSDLETKYIEYIGDCFRIYLLTVTYHIVARRLGICSRLNQHNDDIVVIWKPTFTNNWNYTEYFYMANTQNSNNVYPLNIIRRRYQNIDFILTEKLEDDQLEMIPVIIQNFEIKMMSNHQYCPWNFEVFYFLDICYIIDIKYINMESECKKITKKIEITSNTGEEKQIKRRPKDVKFAIGMIVTHKPDYRTKADGVIIGWYHQCDKKFHNKLKKTVMFPYLCSFSYICKCKNISDSQPHYIILVDNNKIRYVREDQLRIRSPKKIENIEIGKYFSHFKGTHYVPNASLKRHYPNNTAAIARIIAKQKHSSW